MKAMVHIKYNNGNETDLEVEFFEFPGLSPILSDICDVDDIPLDIVKELTLKPICDSPVALDAQPSIAVQPTSETI